MYMYYILAIEMDNIDASEIQDIQHINKTAKLLEVNLHYSPIIKST